MFHFLPTSALRDVMGGIALLQTVWNTEVIEGDLFGVTVTDGSSPGFPIGWQRLSGAGERIFKRQGGNDADLPLTQRVYNDYISVGNSHQLAMALFASDGR